MGHVLMVVRADRTEQRAVLDALALVDKSTPVSAVLNGVEASLLSKYYGQYYYGYGAKGPTLVTRMGAVDELLLGARRGSCPCLADSPALAQNMPNQSGRRSGFSQGWARRTAAGAHPRAACGRPMQYAHNTNLASTGGDSSAGLELAPGAYAAYNSEQFRGAADYSLIGRLWDDGTLDDVTHALAANGRWIAIPELFSVGGDASYGDTLIDSQGGGNYGNLGVFNSGNIAEQATASIRPMLEKRFNDFEFRAAYSYGQVWYLDQGKSGRAETALYSFARTTRRTRLPTSAWAWSRGNVGTWAGFSIRGKVPISTFDAVRVRAGRLDGDRLTRSLSFVGDVGVESELDENTSRADWTAISGVPACFGAVPIVRLSRRAMGSAFSALVTRCESVIEARLLQFNASYDESPQVETRRVNLNDFEPGELPPWLDPSNDLGAFNSEPYVGKNSRIGVTAKGSRTAFRIAGIRHSTRLPERVGRGRAQYGRGLHRDTQARQECERRLPGLLQRQTARRVEPGRR